MACTCPNCSESLSLLKLRQRMVCPKCGSSLIVSLFGATAATVLLWGLVEVFLLALVPSLLMRTVVSGAVGLLLTGMLVKALAKVDLER